MIIDKETPKAPTRANNNNVEAFRCSVCRKPVFGYRLDTGKYFGFKYCPDCGNRIDWEAIKDV